MSNANFQDRLQRIGANAPQHQTSPSVQAPTRPERPGAKKSSFGLAIGFGITAIGFQAVKYANEYYEAIREESGLGTAIGIGVGSIGIILVGAIVLIRAIVKMRSAPAR